ncbi:hypothetical protein V7112_08640 [Bacillus sp. JJ1566]|uniref:hypothetical protein n=1 Tax=Bacillus sp. JJ1566 TaxID=3122961 RepID=UPI002FFF50DF
MDTNTRLIEINEKISGNGRQFITSNDVIWLMNTVAAQQKEIERLKYNSEQERRLNKDLHNLMEYLQDNLVLSEHSYGESISLIALDAL